MKPYKYQGAELDVFSLAVNWKQYWANLILPYIKGHVLEVGAGTGNNTDVIQTLCRDRFSNWTCLEPDHDQMDRLKQTMIEGQPSTPIDFFQGTITDLPVSSGYDTVLYIDVLEHIADDRSEIEKATALLSANGCLVVLSPAHGFLYTAFDREIGHFRRYTVSALKRLTPPGLTPVLARYIDSAGLLVSLANRLLLRQSLPTARQIRIWDGIFVPVSRWLDAMTIGKLGKSVLVVWQKTCL